MHAYHPNHYEALGVARNADAEAIRTAWRQAAKQLHPDLSEGDGSSNEAFLRLQEAYNVLRDPERRADYDETLARQAAAARRPIRAQTATGTARPATPRPRGAPPRRPPREPWRVFGLGGFLAAVGLVVLVAAGILVGQIYLWPEPEPTMIVKVDHDPRARAGRAGSGSGAPELPADPGILTKEVDRAVQTQIGRVEAAKKRMEAQLSELEAHKPSASGGAPSAAASNGGSAAKAPAMVAERVHCIGRGTNIVMTRDNDIAKVSYDNGPQVQPRISDLGTGVVLVSRIEPTNRIAIGFTKGNPHGTTLLLFDEAGRVQQTFNVECTLAAF
jgi:hypothetical protein